MKKFKFLTIILSFAVFLSSFMACAPDQSESSETSSSESSEASSSESSEASSSESSEVSSYELNIMSFNIRWPVGDDWGVRDWDSRKEHVVEHINNSGADIIALQEIHYKKDQYVYVRENLKEDYEIIYFGNEVTLATIYDKTVFNLVSIDKYWLSETPNEPSISWDGTAYRAACILYLEHKATGEMVRSINTHGPLKEEGNVRAFSLLATRSLSGLSHPFTVLCGDFNAEPNQRGYVPIAEKLQDCRVSAKESPNRDKNTYNGYKETPETEPTHRLIDYCFVSKGKNVEVLSYKVRTDKWGEGNHISDHYAVQTTVRVNLK